jgi:hypothetical protein
MSEVGLRGKALLSLTARDASTNPNIFPKCVRTHEERTSLLPFSVPSLFAWRTLAGYEVIHMIRKGQACGSAPAARGSSAPSLYCWYVWNLSLIHLVIAPTCPSISKLQHYPINTVALSKLGSRMSAPGCNNSSGRITCVCRVATRNHSHL